jgi:hypothetical protein
MYLLLGEKCWCWILTDGNSCDRWDEAGIGLHAGVEHESAPGFTSSQVYDNDGVQTFRRGVGDVGDTLAGFGEV